ncbi:T-complex protein 1 subunit theta [Perkinsus chesapeaki]|uniref:CCT-theta n=1 Tax=Perkinsus chesapeaki TaxID=330153 RepID=A0A7J6MF30_PERCH|nr:T-complex protein 1 subunit theta [Perkinsus chesapeaki]
MFKGPVGIQSLLKDGTQSYAGVDEALLKNIEASKYVSEITRTSLGPCGTNKLIVNHINKHFVTSDTATVLKELEIYHPAAKLVVMAVQAQEQECGDATNLVSIITGELLDNAEQLLKQGIHASDIIRGYEMAGDHVVKCLNDNKDLVAFTLGDMKSVDQLSTIIKPVLGAKQYGLEDTLTRLVAKACCSVMPEDPKKFNIDNIRVAKLPGCGNIHNSYVVDGMVTTRDTMGIEKHKKNCKVAVYGCGLEMTGTETPGTVLLESGKQLMEFAKGEEKKMEEFVKSLVDAGVEAVIVGGAIQDIALHFLNKYHILTIKCTSKFEMRRLCCTLGATGIVRLGAPLPDELGFAESIDVEEISSAKVTVVRAPDSKVSTIVLRGATANFLDEVERAIDDAVNVVRCCAVKGQREFVVGGGGCEVSLGLDVAKFGQECSGLEQYAVLKFAESLEVVANIIAENAGLNAMDAVTTLKAAHASGQTKMCIDVDAPNRRASPICDAVSKSVLDHRGIKSWAIRLAIDAVLTILRIQHIIVAKQAGAPQTKGTPYVDDE